MGYTRHRPEPVLSRYTVDENGCWRYQGEINRYGYGIITFGQHRDGNRVRWLAHRYFYTELVAPVPAHLVCCHKCDVRSCVNPDHIFIGTSADNVADMMAKGRQGKTGAKGERNGFAKIDPETAMSVRLATGTNREIAERFGITRSSAQAIRSGRNWRHL